MPIYEFYCPDCHVVFSFLSRRVNTRKRPACPRCGRPRLERRPSTFAVSRGLTEDDDLPFGDMDEDRVEKALESLAGELDGIDENDPRQAAHAMRRLFEATGMPIGAGMEEALRRMEAGEDPDKVEEELGDVLEDEGELFGGGRPKLKALRNRVLPPRVDPKLYEL